MRRRDRRRPRSDLHRRTCSRRSASCRARARRRAVLFQESDVVAALKKAAESGVTLQNIRSVAGFERRLNDVTCSGCHQTRGIGGFHFPGVDWMAANPSNSTRRAGLAAFLRRSGPSPRHSHLDARRQAVRITRADSPAGRNCAAARNSPEPNTKTAGARIVMPTAPNAADNDKSFQFVDLRRGAGVPGRRPGVANGDVLR